MAAESSKFFRQFSKVFGPPCCTSPGVLGQKGAQRWGGGLGMWRGEWYHNPLNDPLLTRWGPGQVPKWDSKGNIAFYWSPHPN